MATESTLSADWPGRYYHIDQVLDTPGPRTDPAFLAGDGVRDSCFSISIPSPASR
jgi:ubiquitin-activating enzyme E1 C